MKCIEALVAGIRGAENGHVELYRRGTATRATWYSTFEGSGADASGNDIPLDSNGSAIVFVDELVDVVVYTSADVLARPLFCAGEAATSVEVISNSFTGTDYVTAASGAGEPTTLQAVLDAVLTSFGEEDWKVANTGVVGGSTMQALVQQLNLGIFNVKDSTYGAVGDGVAADSAAIQAALTAAALGTAGGIVWCPQGTYRLTTKVSIPQNVTIVAYGSTFVLDHATNDAFGMTINGEKRARILGARFTNAQTGTGRFLDYDVAAGRMVLRDCVFIPAFGTGNLVELGTNASSGELAFENCYLRPHENSTGAIQALAAGRIRVEHSDFIHPSAANKGLVYCDTATLANFELMGNYFDVSNSASGSAFFVRNNATGGNLRCIGNRFTGIGGGTSGAVGWQGLTVPPKPASALDSSSDTIALFEYLNDFAGLTVTLI